MEIATLAAIALIVGLTFRSVVAPLVTLVTAGVGYLLADRVIGYLAGVAQLTVPVEIEPILIALMLGIMTDYSFSLCPACGGSCAPGRPTQRPPGKPSASTSPLC